MNIKELEKKINSHILFIYNNLMLQDTATIDQQMIKEVYKHIQKMNTYDSLTLLLNTRGGNLASGYKIIHMLKEKFHTINVMVVERCSSTGTFIALSSDKLYVSPYAVITPTEPQMQIYDGSGENISVNAITKFLEKPHISLNINKLDAVTYANYLSTISYFKKLCYNTYEESKADKIIKYMLEDVSSHQYPLMKKDFQKMGIDLFLIPEDIITIIEKEHERLISFLQCKNQKNIKHTIIRSSEQTSVYEKDIDQHKNKIAEGYFNIKEEEIMKNLTNQNERVKDIIQECEIEQTAPDYQDASAHWDSYNDSCYHDNYNDRYDDYGDNSYYHDCYKDAVQTEVPKAKVKTPKEVK